MPLSKPLTSSPSRATVRFAAQTAPATSMQRARDGSVIWWGDADTPGPPSVVSPGAAASVTVAVSPVRPGHAVMVDYRINRGPVRQAAAAPEPRAHDGSARLFRAILPGQRGGVVEFMPVLRFAGQAISPSLAESAGSPRYKVGPAVAPIEAAGSPASPDGAPGGQPRWDWSTRYLGSLTATLRKELVGAGPDGLRIDWHVTGGRIVGPGLEGAVLPGATDWMRIRPDGIGVVNVQACFETRTGARIYASYGGVLDLGPDGYNRALHDDVCPFPPLVVAPTFVTADKQFEWLNRAQCVGVGRVDTRAPRVEWDLYTVLVGGRAVGGQ